MENVHESIHAEFFSILENSKLFTEVIKTEEGSFKLSSNFPSDLTALRVKTSKGWQPTPVLWVESLLEEIFQFWEKNAPHIYENISQSTFDFIQTQPILFQKGIRKFGCFFDAVIIPDQLLLLHNEHFTDSRSFVDWNSLVLTVLRCGVTYLENKELFLPKNKKLRILLVPPKRIVDKKFEEKTFEAVLTMSGKFFSEICAKEIRHPLEFVDEWMKSGEQSMNKALLNKVYNRYGASNFSDYYYNQRKQAISEHGAPNDIKGENRLIAMIIDISARFSEFERSHGESFCWGHEAEIPDDDTALFDWWFNESSKTLSSISGTRLSESEIIKFGIQSEQMAFLRKIEIKQLIDLLDTDSVEKLREDFKFSRLKIKRLNNHNLNDNIVEIGNFMEEKINNFQTELSTLETALSQGTWREWGRLGVSLAITAASTAFPPLSAFSFLYGGDLSSINKNDKNNKKILDSIKERPIATLADWKSTNTGN